MAATKTRKRGRHPQYAPSDVELMQSRIDEYFFQCDKDKRPYTIMGLALAMGFNTRKSILDYQGKDEFVNTIKNAKARVEMQREEGLVSGSNAVGNIFWLKNNAGEAYRDRTEQDINHHGDFALFLKQIDGESLILPSQRGKNGE